MAIVDPWRFRVRVDYFRGNITPETDRLDLLRGREPLAIGDLIPAEVLQGFDSDRDLKQAQRLLTSLTIVDIGGMEIAVQAAKNFRRLRTCGARVRKTIDAIIAARYIESAYDRLHNDRDFDPIAIYPGL